MVSTRARTECAHWLFEIVTLTGSWRILFPLTIAATVALALVKRCVEAMLLVASGISGTTIVYILRGARRFCARPLKRRVCARHGHELMR
jgi:hypothetical protein